MKQSDLKHLRRLVGWIRCEIGESPEEYVAGVQAIADKLGHPPIDDAARQRLVEGYDRRRAVPKYVREAVKALDRYARAPGAVVEVKVHQKKASGRVLLVQRKPAGGPGQ
ncbi:hypothetical protein [Acidovorax sp.]|uniref:hypothetical protein n=1 Tax=Acidovorax sp. TaxID=1872122 RepID=UPI00391F4030